MTPEERDRRNWKAILRVAPILAIGIPAILLSEHYLGRTGQGLIGIGVLVGMFTYVHFLPKLPDD